MLETINQAEKMLDKATVFQVATIDKLGFPNIVALTPLPLDRSLDTVFFYTTHSSSTVKNLSRSTNAAIYCFDESKHSSLMLKGRFMIVSPSSLSGPWQEALNSFQRSLNYPDPSILRFTSLAFKIREAGHISYSDLQD